MIWILSWSLNFLDFKLFSLNWTFSSVRKASKQSTWDMTRYLQNRDFYEALKKVSTFYYTTLTKYTKAITSSLFWNSACNHNKEIDPKLIRVLIQLEACRLAINEDHSRWRSLNNVTNLPGLPLCDPQLSQTIIIWTKINLNYPMIAISLR